MKKLLLVICLLCAGCSNSKMLSGRFWLHPTSGVQTDIGMRMEALSSPYRIGTIPTSQFEWMRWHVINQKLGKFHE